jgi:hypothetical protein
MLNLSYPTKYLCLRRRFSNENQDYAYDAVLPKQASICLRRRFSNENPEEDNTWISGD